MWASSIKHSTTPLLFPLYQVPVPWKSPAHVTDISKYFPAYSRTISHHYNHVCLLLWWSMEEVMTYTWYDFDVDIGGVVMMMMTAMLTMMVVGWIIGLTLERAGGPRPGRLGAPGQTVRPLFWSSVWWSWSSRSWPSWWSHLQHIFHYPAMLSYFLCASDDKLSDITNLQKLVLTFEA